MSLWAKYYYHSNAASGKNRQPPSAGYVEARGKLVGQLQAWAILRTAEAAALGAGGGAKPRSVGASAVRNELQDEEEERADNQIIRKSSLLRLSM